MVERAHSITLSLLQPLTEKSLHREQKYLIAPAYLGKEWIDCPKLNLVFPNAEHICPVLTI